MDTQTLEQKILNMLDKYNFDTDNKLALKIQKDNVKKYFSQYNDTLAKHTKLTKQIKPSKKILEVEDVVELEEEEPIKNNTRNKLKNIEKVDNIDKLSDKELEIFNDVLKKKTAENQKEIKENKLKKYLIEPVNKNEEPQKDKKEINNKVIINDIEDIEEINDLEDEIIIIEEPKRQLKRILNVSDNIVNSNKSIKEKIEERNVVKKEKEPKILKKIFNKNYEFTLDDGNKKLYTSEGSAYRHQFRSLTRNLFKDDCVKYGKTYNPKFYECIVNYYYKTHDREELKKAVNEKKPISLMDYWLSLNDEEKKKAVFRNPSFVDY